MLFSFLLPNFLAPWPCKSVIFSFEMTPWFFFCVCVAHLFMLGGHRTFVSLGVDDMASPSRIDGVILTDPLPL